MSVFFMALIPYLYHWFDSNANFQDRSPSPARNRSRSPSQRRDYEASRDGAPQNSRPFRQDDRRDDRRGGFRREGGRRPYEDRGSHGEEISRNYDNSIFIGNVPFESTTRDIEEMFGKNGRIVHAGVIRNRGRSRGMAFVEFDNSQTADDAIRQFDRTTLGGREIFVRKDLPPPGERNRDEGDRRDRRDRREPRDRRDNDPRRNDRRDERPRERREKPVADLPRPGTEIFVGNLPFSTTWQSLKDLFRDAGDVIRADVMTNKWGKSRGFGTVVFSNADDADNAVEKFENFVLEGRTIEVRHGKDPAERRPVSKNSEFTEGVEGHGDPSNTIYVGNLPFITTQTDLFELFETIGRVTRAEVQFDLSGRPSGCAVVEFELVDLAELAIKNLDRYNYGGRNLGITFARIPNSQGLVSEEQMEQEQDQYVDEPQDVPPINAPEY